MRTRSFYARTPTRPTKVATASPVIAEGAELRGDAATHGPHEVDHICDVPDSSDNQDAPTRAFPSAQTGKHSRDERPYDENEARKRKKASNRRVATKD